MSTAFYLRNVFSVAQLLGSSDTWPEEVMAGGSWTMSLHLPARPVSHDPGKIQRVKGLLLIWVLLKGDQKSQLMKKTQTESEEEL